MKTQSTKLRPDLEPSQVPAVQATLPSPLQYGYRTKLTPHFNPPPKQAKLDAGEPALSIGFEERGRKRIVDIEQCPIATQQINEGLIRERKRVQEYVSTSHDMSFASRQTTYSTISTFKRGATLLLRHALPAGKDDDTPYCETDHKARVRERVGGIDFEFTAGVWSSVPWRKAKI